MPAAVDRSMKGGGAGVCESSEAGNRGPLRWGGVGAVVMGI